MRRCSLVWILAACGTPAPPAAPPHNTAVPETAAHDAGGLPIEVATLVERWTNCWHFNGEEAYSPERAKEIQDGRDAWCPGIHEERARLQAKYRASADVEDALRKLDELQ